MKFFILLAALILAAATLGWHDHQRLVSVREHHARLAASAASPGFFRDLSHPADPIRITKRERESQKLEARVTATDFIVMAEEIVTYGKEGPQWEDAGGMRMAELIERLVSLDAAQLKSLITEVRGDKALKNKSRENLLNMTLMTLANDRPQTAVTLFTESPDLFDDSSISSRDVVSKSLAKWAENDATAALVWVRKTGEKFPDLVTDDAKCAMISGTAVKDPMSAFKLIAGLGIKDTERAFSGIFEAARTAEERTATLAALRSHLATFTNEKARAETAHDAMNTLTEKIVDQQSFESASQWVAAAKFTPEELQDFADGLNYYNIIGKQGQWIEWLGKTLPAGKSDGSIGSLVRRWTQSDYQAAGQWLSSTPAGPSKNTAIRSYAETISASDPATATQWALTLPPGEDRDETLEKIRQNNPQE